MIKGLMVLLKIPLVAEILLLDMFFVRVSYNLWNALPQRCLDLLLCLCSDLTETTENQPMVRKSRTHIQRFMPCNTLHRLMMTSCSCFFSPQVIKELLSTSGTNRKQWGQPASLHFSEFPKKPSQILKKAVQWHLYDLTFKLCLSVLVLFSICYDGFSVHVTFLWCCWWFILICYKLPWWLQPKRIQEIK